MKKIIVTGGTGLIGRALCALLKIRGYQVAVLSTQKITRSPYITYYWDPVHEIMDEEALQGADAIIHLAGANMAGERWRDARKRLIIQSRVDTADFLYSRISRQKDRTGAFISASGIGYYGSITSSYIFKETDQPGRDFPAEVCRRWENAADRFQTLGIRTVKIRTGIVLSDQGGALTQMMAPVKSGFGAPLAGGNQYMPWIHMADLCEIYIRAIEKTDMQGVYNAVAPEHVTNLTFMRALAAHMKRPFILPSVPAGVLKLVFGEMANMLVRGSRVSSEKIRQNGFSFQFPDLNSALSDLIKVQ